MDKLPQRDVFATPWFRVVAKEFAAPSGEQQSYYSLVLADYVAVVAVTDDNRFVLVRQFRPTPECWTLELPAGTVDGGETAEQSARRELQEETGLTAAHWELLGMLEPDTGRLGNKMACFLAQGIQCPAFVRAAEPGLEVQLATRDELSNLIQNGHFNHALHLAALFLAMFRRRLPALHAA